MRVAHTFILWTFMIAACVESDDPKGDDTAATSSSSTKGQRAA